MVLLCAHSREVFNMPLKKHLPELADQKLSDEEGHDLIFPMRVSSDDIDPTQQNLWVVDEKLSYHYYLASDLPFNSMEPLEIDNNKRPDIMVLDNPLPDTPAAFVEGELP